MSLLRLVTRATLTPGRELELVARHRRADGHADEARLDSVRGERGLEHAARLLDEALIDLLRRAASEEVQRRELPRSPSRRGAERDLELLDDLGLGFGLVLVDRDVELGRRFELLVVLVGRIDLVLVVFGLDVVDEGHRLVDGTISRTSMTSSPAGFVPNRSPESVDIDPTTRRAAACTGRTPSAARAAIARNVAR